MLPDLIYIPLLEIVSSVGADMTSECRAFLDRKFMVFSGNPTEFVDYVKDNVQYWFYSVCSPPEWIQNAEWQFDEGVPMQFLGQLPIPNSANMFHDDAAVFVFGNREGVFKTVLQVS